MMKEGLISFKFRSEKVFDSLKFYGDNITLGDLRRMIEERRIRFKEIEGGKKRESYELLFYDNINNRKYLDDTDLIPSNSQLIVQRVPANATDYILNFSSDVQIEFEAGNKAESEYFIGLARRNPNLLSKGFNDVPAHFQAGNFSMFNKTQGIPIGASSEYEKVNDYLKGQNVDPKYTEKEILDMLSNARFFIIKSANQENINLSRIYNEWATTKANESKLIEAYKSSPNVILLFSVNKSSHFQGFARMTSLVSSNVGYYWKNNDSIKLGGCFNIEWITTAFLSFGRLTNYNNPLNSNEPIRKSRDTQELPPPMGYEICKMFKIPQLKEDPAKLKDDISHSSDDFFDSKKPKDPWGAGTKPPQQQNEAHQKKMAQKEAINPFLDPMRFAMMNASHLDPNRKNKKSPNGRNRRGRDRRSSSSSPGRKRNLKNNGRSKRSRNNERGRRSRSKDKRSQRKRSRRP